MYGPEEKEPVSSPARQGKGAVRFIAALVYLKGIGRMWKTGSHTEGTKPESIYRGERWVGTLTGSTFDPKDVASEIVRGMNQLESLRAEVARLTKRAELAESRAKLFAKTSDEQCARADGADSKLADRTAELQRSQFRSNEFQARMQLAQVYRSNIPPIKGDIGGNEFK